MEHLKAFLYRHILTCISKLCCLCLKYTFSLKLDSALQPGRVGTMTMYRCVVEKWERRKSRVVHAPWREAELKTWCEGQADMGSLCCHLGPCDIQACAAAKGHVWVCDSIAAGVFVDVYGPCCHWGPFRSPWSELPSDAMLVPKGHAASRAILIWVVYTAIQGHGAVQAQAAAKGHVWVLVQLGSVLMFIACVTTRGHMRAEPGGLDIGELVLSIAGCLSGRTGPSGVISRELALDLDGFGRTALHLSSTGSICKRAGPTLHHV